MIPTTADQIQSYRGRQLWTNRLARITASLIVVSCVSLFLGAAGSIWNDRWLHVVAGATATLIVLVPPLIRREIASSSWMLVVLATVIGCLFRSYAMVFSDSPDVKRLFLTDADPSSLVGPYCVFILGMVLFAAGFTAAYCRRRRPRSWGLLRSREVSEGRARVVTVLLVVASLTAFAAYTQLTGGFNVGQLSAKRTAITADTLSDATSFRGYQWLRFLHEFGAIAFLLQFALFVTAKRRSLGRSVMMLLLFFNAVSLSIYTSERIALVSLLAAAIAIAVHVGHRVSLQAILGITLMALVVFHILTLARTDQTYRLVRSGNVAQTAVDVVDSLVINRNLIDLSKSTHIIRAVPETLPYQHGATFAAYLVAPIPREVWPDKPIISAGPIIGTKLYGQRSSGVPPGGVAELFWNFGAFGVAAGALPLGLLFGLLDRSIRYGTANWRLATVAYVFTFEGTMLALANGPALGLFRIALGLIQVTVVLLLVTLPQGRHGDPSMARRGEQLLATGR